MEPAAASSLIPARRVLRINVAKALHLRSRATNRDARGVP
jgi:hypothetical protein